MANRWGNTGHNERLYFLSVIKSLQMVTAAMKLKMLAPKKIKRRLLLGRKAMINLDSILKSRDIILPIKLHLVKIMVLAVVMYGYQIWTINKAEC